MPNPNPDPSPDPNPSVGGRAPGHHDLDHARHPQRARGLRGRCGARLAGHVGAPPAASACLGSGLGLGLGLGSEEELGLGLGPRLAGRRSACSEPARRAAAPPNTKQSLRGPVLGVSGLAHPARHVTCTAAWVQVLGAGLWAVTTSLPQPLMARLAF